MESDNKGKEAKAHSRKRSGSSSKKPDIVGELAGATELNSGPPTLSSIAILVLGMHRSGTSVLTGILHKLGADAPRTLMAANAFNPKGYAESSKLMEIHNRLLASAGSDWSDWGRFNHDWSQSPAADAFRQEIRDAVRSEFPNSMFFAVKDPRVCRFADVWLDLFDKDDTRSLPIIAFRNPIEVAASLNARDGMSPQRGHLLWLRHVLDAERFTRGRARVFVNYHDVLRDWRSVVRGISQRGFLQFPRFSAKIELEIDEFVDQSLHNQTSSDRSVILGGGISSFVRSAYSALIEGAQNGDSPALHRLFDGVSGEFDHACDAFGLLVTRLERENNQLTRRLQDTTTRLQAATEVGQSSDRAVAQLTSDLDEMTKRALAAETDEANVNRDFAALESKFRAALEDVKRDAANMLADEAKAREALNKTHDALQAELHKREAEHSRQTSGYREIIERVESEVAEVRADATQRMQASLEQIDALTEEFERRSNEFFRRDAAHRELVDRLTAEISTAQTNAALQKRTSLEQHVALTAELERRESEILEREAAHRAALDRLSAQTTEARNAAIEQVSALKAEVVAITDQIEKARLHSENLASKEFERHQETRRHAEAAQEALANKCASLERALAASKDRIASLEKIASTYGLSLARFERETAPADKRVRKEADEGKKPEASTKVDGTASHSVVAELFDADWYRKANQIPPDADNLLAHFLDKGFRQGFDPNPLFNTAWYLTQNPDVVREDINPLVHFAIQGARERRWPHPLFDIDWYVLNYGNEIGDDVNPLVDFLGDGWKRGRNPNAAFDVAYYLNRYQDVRRSGMNPLAHYDRFGAKEGRSASATFDTAWYRDRYPDVATGSENPLAHYLRAGLQEGRRTAPTPEEAISQTAGQQPHVNGGPSILLVAHAISHSGHRFGAERSFIDMAASLSRIGCNVHVALPGRDPAYAEALAPFARDISAFSYSWWREDAEPDDVVLLRFKHLIESKRVDLVYANTIMLREPLLAARALSVKCAVHCRELIDQDQHLAEVIGSNARQIVERVLARSDLVVANSRATAALYGAGGQTVAIVPNIVDGERFKRTDRRKIGDAIRIGILSSNLVKKGILDFAEIAKKSSGLANAEFHVFGPETDITRDLKSRKITGELPGSLVFDGYVDDPATVIQSLDIVLCLSTFAESFGRSVAEAMAAECLVISYNLGAIPELIQHGKSGLLVDVGDLTAVCDLIADFVADPVRYDSIREEGRRYILERHAPAAMDAQYAELLKPACLLSKKNLTEQRTGVAVASSSASKRPLRIAYFCWHFPVPSETFVLNELRALKKLGHDLHVFCRQSPHPDFAPDFEISYSRVTTPEQLAQGLLEFRADVVHGHFVYPTVTEFLWPAAERAGVDFTFIAHAQDIFRYANAERNRIAEIARSPRCRKVFTLSRFHHAFLERQGVPAAKIAINSNGVDPDLFYLPHAGRGVRPSIFTVGRFVEKKGISNLVKASHRLAGLGIDIYLYGYGDTEDALRELARSIGADNVKFAGRISGITELLNAFAKHDLCICPAIRAPDGDMDGIPTVLMEAMAAGVPVMATDISGIPDLVIDEVTGFHCDPHPDAIADAVERFFALPAGRIQRTISAAKDHVRAHYDVKRLADNMLRVWRNETIDIVIVSWNNLPELKEVVRRLQKYTTFPYRLSICDNQSRPDVVDYLQQLEKDHHEVLVHFNTSNAMVGPGTNIAMSKGVSEFVIYVCGKEGFALDFNWEHPFYYGLRDNPQAALAGTLCYSPSYLSGRDMATNNKRFENFRNRDFAYRNPDRQFLHIQGGLFGMRRAAIESIGGFSRDVPHDGTDVEMSYVLESEGWELHPIKGMTAIFNKTRPDLTARVDESVRILHPPALTDLAWLDEIAQGKSSLCPICGWRGRTFDGGLDAHTCPQCGSTEDERSIWRYLSQTTLTYRRLPAVGIDIGPALLKLWKEQFQGSVWTRNAFLAEIKARGRLANRPGNMALCLVTRLSEMPDDSQRETLAEFRRLLDTHAGKLVVVDDPRFLEAPLFSTMGFKRQDVLAFSSRACRFGWRSVATFGPK